MNHLLPNITFIKMESGTNKIASEDKIKSEMMSPVLKTRDVNVMENFKTSKPSKTSQSKVGT